MATYKHLRSSTANKRPTTSIADGQLAINSNAASAGLFFKDSTGATIIKVGPVHVGTTAPNATPGAGGSSGNSTGEVWLDTSLTPVGVKIWNGSAWVNGTPIGSTTVQGLLELATDAETQAGSDTARAVTPASLQSKVSDSTSTTSSTTIASSTAVKSAFDLANAALPKSGGTVTGNLEIGTAGSLTFEGSVADGFETTIAVTNPTVDRTITLPDTTGTVVTTGDTGTVTSTMLLDGTIVNADVNASAAIAGTKIAPDFGSQTVQTTGIVSHALGTALAPTVTFTGDTNTGIYSPGADQLAISTNGTGRLFVDVSGNVDFTAAGLKVTTGRNISATAANSNISIFGGDIATNTGANIELYGGSHATLANLMILDAGEHRFRSADGSSERARIDSSGRLLVGTSTDVNVRGLGHKFQIAGSNFTNASQVVLRHSADANSPGIEFAKTRGTTATSVTTVSDGDNLGQFIFSGADGSGYVQAAQITAQVDGTPGANDMPGRIVLSTTADGASSPTERFRITNDGVIAHDQPAPAAVNATATLTVANLKAGIITSTSAAATDMTLPTGTDTQAGFSGTYDNFIFEWSVINTGPSLVRVLAGTAHTVVGSGSVATGTSGRFASRRTAANTFVTYRLS